MNPERGFKAFANFVNVSSRWISSRALQLKAAFYWVSISLSPWGQPDGERASWAPAIKLLLPHSHVFNVFHVEAKRRQNRHREWNILFIQLSIVNMKSLFSFYSCTKFRSPRIEDRIDGYRFCSRQIEKHDNIARYVRLEQFSFKAGNVRYHHGSAKST